MIEGGHTVSVANVTRYIITLKGTTKQELMGVAG